MTTAIDGTDPFASVRTTPTTSATPKSSDDNQMGQDTFLKLLVAQLKYQNPLAPTDGTEFLTQTAQFTMVEKLNQIADDQKSMQTTNQVLAASAMVGRSVTYGISGDKDPVATKNIRLGGSLPADAPVGTRVATTSAVYNTAGTKVPIEFDFTRTATGWDVRASSSGTPIGKPASITFDATGEHTSGDISLAADDLDLLAGTTGTWPATGVLVQLGAATDPDRLHTGSGVNTVSVREQDGSDGQTRNGIVTGIRIDADGAHVQVNGEDVAVTSVTQVEDAA